MTHYLQNGLWTSQHSILITHLDQDEDSALLKQPK